jgi:hypothetical protein
MIVQMWHGRVPASKEDKDFLLEFEPMAVHHEVAGGS